MKRMLTDAFVKTLKPPIDGRLEIGDLGCRGLALRVTPLGQISWTYRYSIGSDVKRMTLGTYPTLSLADARQEADGFRRQIRDGVDPIVAQRNLRSEAMSKTKSFGHLCERYMIEHAQRHCRQRTAEEYQRIINMHLLPHWAERNYDSLSRAELVERVEEIARKTPVQANRVSALLVGIFNFAIDVGVMTATPAMRLRRPGKEQASTRVLSDEEIRAFWPGVMMAPATEETGIALRLTLLLGLRAGEIAGLRRDEVKGDAIELLGERTKNGKPHRLPLSPLAFSLVTRAAELSASKDFIFRGRPGPKDLGRGRSIGAHTLSEAMNRFAERTSIESWRADPPTPHDLRRTLRTRLSSLGTQTEVSDAIMNHTPQDVGRKHYDQYRYDAEKRRALEAWSNAVEAIVNGTPANVVALRRA